MQQLLSYLRRCIDDYHMIAPNDQIAVGVSGGKDSLTLLVLLAQLRRFYPNPFSLQAITLDLGYDNTDFSGVQALCSRLNVPFTVRKTDIKQIVFDIRKESNPCSLCAKLRRGALHDEALKLGCKKIALGHHFDDAAETFLLSLFFEGRISCFSPVAYLDRRDVTLIRPMLFIEEKDIVNFASREQLPVVFNPCPADKDSSRQDVKQLLVRLEREYPHLRQRIVGSMQRYPLKGWER